MQMISAGILLYRHYEHSIEFFLVHPGGPFFKRKDQGYWTIPKGEPGPGESLVDCACREFYEETGFHPGTAMIELKPVRQKAGKLVHAWLVEGDIDTGLIRSNLFSIPWPPGSSELKHFPEIDQARWMNAEEAINMINAAQASLIVEACTILNVPVKVP